MKCALLVSALLGAANGEWTEEWSAELRQLSSNDSSNSSNSSSGNATSAPAATSAPNASNATTLAPVTTLAPGGNATNATTLAPTTLASSGNATTLAPTTLAPTTLAPTTLASSGNATATTLSPTDTPAPLVVTSDVAVAFPADAVNSLKLAANAAKLSAVTKAVGSVNFKTYCEAGVVAGTFNNLADCKSAFTTSGGYNAGSGTLEIAMTEKVFGGAEAAKLSSALDLTSVSRRLAAHEATAIINKITLTAKMQTAAQATQANGIMAGVSTALSAKASNATEATARFDAIKNIAEADSAGLFSTGGLLSNVTALTTTVSTAPVTGLAAPAAVSSAATVAVSAAASLVMGALFLF